MKFIHVKRKTRYEQRYSVKMGMLKTKVTYIKKAVMGIPVRTLHTYRKTYYGEVKACNDCVVTL